MRAGGIFGGDSLGFTPGDSGAGDTTLAILCTLAKNKGMFDRQMGRAFTRYVPTSPAEDLIIANNPQQVIACYKSGWDNAANTACLTARTLGENDKRSGRASDTTGLVKKTAGNVEDVVLLVDCYNTGYNNTTAAGPAKTSPPDPGTPPPDPGDGGGTGTRLTTTVTGACTSQEVIMAVQTKLGVDNDGKWGPKSQAALKASGMTFKDVAPGCSGDKVPYYGGSGLTTTVATTTPGGIAPAVKPPLLAGMGDMTKSPIFWAVGLALVVTGYFYMSKPEKGRSSGSSKTRRNARRARR